MQEFAPGKAALCIALQQLNCFTKKYRTAVRIMKLTAIILLAACLQLSAKGVSQTITLSLKDAPIQTVFKEIERQTQYTFFADVRWFHMAKKVTIEVKSLPLNQVLNLCFKDQPFTYSISGKTITIAPKKEQADKDLKTSTKQNPVIDVKGRVVNSKGEPIAGATVAVQGTNKTTTTNNSGEFSLSGVDENAVIQITHVQFEPESITLNGHGIVNATLQIKVSSLDEMQVIAYGTTTKRLNTGNVTTVKAVEIEKQPIQNPLLALQGKVPGMSIVQSNGLPGSGVTVRIRGQNSISSGIDPLYIIDGVPYSSQLLPLAGSVLGSSGARGGNGGNITGNPLSYLNPSDIESIEILKDADATAIYGSRGANGVVLITTKKGKQGRMKIAMNIQTGWGKVDHFLKLLNTSEYIEMRKEAKLNDNRPIGQSDFDINGLYDSTKFTDWQKKLIGGTALYHDAQTSVSGGSENFQYLVGAGYFKQTTVYPGDFSNKKGSLHFNLNATSVNKKFKLELSGSYVHDKNNLSQSDLTSLAVTLPPNAPDLLLSDGTLNWAEDTLVGLLWPNGIQPLAYIKRKFEIQTNNLIGRGSVSYEIIKGLNAKLDLGYTNLQMYSVTTNPFSAIAPLYHQFSTRSSNFLNSYIRSWIVEPQLNYSRGLLGGTIKLLLGITNQQQTNNGQGVYASGFSSDFLIENLAAATTLSGSTDFTQYKYNAVFGRLNYNWREKYLISLTGRRDGSSRFGPENRFHNFGAIGAGWIFSQERFIKNKLHFISYGKIRASYGSTGNDQVGNYSFINLYSPTSYQIPYQNSGALTINEIYNPYLEWEETKKFEVAIDFGLIRDRLLITTSYYNNYSGNQLLQYKLPNITGFTSVTTNFPAKIRNYGLEIEMNTTNIKSKNFTWRTSLNLTLPRNKLVSFPGLENSTYQSSLVIGRPIGILPAYKFLGVDSAGVYFFEAKDGTPTNNPDSQMVSIDLSPRYYGGFQNSFIYKGFQLDVLFQFTKQIGRNYMFGFYPGQPLYNQPRSVLDRWRAKGDNATIQRYNSNYSLSRFESRVRASDGIYSDASFIRLKNVAISWQLPPIWLKKTHMQTAKLYIHAQNLFTITNYIGMDPETQSASVLPPLRVITAGVQCSF